MNEEHKYIDFEAYERVAEPHKRERVSAWRTAIGLQDVNGLRVSEYLKETAVKHIEGLQVKDTRIIIPEYLFVACRSNYKSFIEGLTSYDMLNQNNLRSKKIPVPSIEVQKQIITHVYKNDKQIAEIAKLREEAPSRKQAILDKYLK